MEDAFKNENIIVGNNRCCPWNIIIEKKHIQQQKCFEN